MKLIQILGFITAIGIFLYGVGMSFLLTMAGLLGGSFHPDGFSLVLLGIFTALGTYSFIRLCTDSV